MNSGLITILQSIVNNSDSNDIDTIISYYLLNNLYKDNLSINLIANDCNTSKASVTRFVQNLGFSGFNDFKSSYQYTFIEKEEMKVDLCAYTDTKSNAPDNSKTDIASQFETVAAELAEFAHIIDEETIDHLCSLIHHANKVSIFSTLIPGHISEIIQHFLLTAGKYVEFRPPLHSQLDRAKQLKEGDLSIFISLEGSYVMQRDLTLTISNSKATSVLITQNENMKLASLFDHIYQLGEHGLERSGKYKLLMFVEHLANRYFTHYVD